MVEGRNIKSLVLKIEKQGGGEKESLEKIVMEIIGYICILFLFAAGIRPLAFV